ncbi:MAG: anti-sigma factor family protein [Planctomycetota bacterium]|jgi:hypothetical protein
MNREHINIVMNRIIDGEANATEREELSRALKADPMLSEEYAEMQLVHRATENLFNELRLPQSFSKNVMDRLQPRGVDDANVDSVRLPSLRSHSGGHRHVAHPKPRKNVFTLVASLASAAAILLTAGILFASMSNNTVTEDPNSLVSDDDGSVSVDNGDNRTDPLASDPKRGDAPEQNSEASPESSETVKNGPDSEGDSNKKSPHEESLPEKIPGETIIKNGPESEDVSPPETPEQPVKGPVVEDEDETPILPEKPEDVVEGPEKNNGEDDRKTDVTPENRRKIGSMTVLAGHLLAFRNGDWHKLDADAEILEGSRLKTNVNGVVMLELDYGRITLGKGSEVEFSNDSTVEVLDGEVSVSRNSLDMTGTLTVTAKNLTWTQLEGVSVVELKRSGIELKNVVGKGQLYNENNGVIEVENGYEVRADFEKDLKEGRAKRLTAPDWNADSRAVYMTDMLAPVISDRGYADKELKYLNRYLLRDLSKLMRQPVHADGLFDALSASVNNVCLSGPDLITIVDEIDRAVFKHQNRLTEELMVFATDAGDQAENMDNWKLLFAHQITPPVKNTNPAKKPTVPNTNKPAPT